MQTSTELRSLLNRIDHRGYPAYKDTKGMYQFPGYVLSIDHVQGDPFASPSKVSVHVKGKTATSGSSTMFSTPPVTCPIMLSLLFPSARIHWLSARLLAENGAPIKIYLP